jgi:glycerol uptake facilitator-like aquaporin
VFAVGLVLMVNIVLLGPISNSHVNPAVTLGVLIRESGEERSSGKLGHNIWYGIRIMLSQIAGAILGACIITLLRYSKGPNENIGMARLCGGFGPGGATC